jgi:RNA polymerase sigma-70 factor (ECF subfamily)
MDEQSVASYQPYWAVRAHLLRQARCDATAAFDRAIELADDPAVRTFLRERRDA